ncbi:hypothetical protein D3C86_2144760 [compost metagenome]
MEELQAKKVPMPVIMKLRKEAIDAQQDFESYVAEQERKAREAGVSLTLYVRQGMNK